MDDAPVQWVPGGEAFDARLARHGLQLSPRRLRTLQVNLTKRCNQACRHCHVDASPSRSESLSAPHVERIIEILAAHPQIAQLDLTGGAPELHPQFDHLVRQAHRLDREVIVRHNLTVQLDGHPVSGASMTHLPAFFAAHRVQVVSSLPCYSQDNTDEQRGKGVFAKSIEALRRLNAVGYGKQGGELSLTLVYNPLGAHLPPPQARLQVDYQRELWEHHGLVFNRLITITNMPIHRFALQLRKQGQLEGYQSLLESAFNPAAAEAVMCRDLISVDHAGRLYDCDFNQQLGMQARDEQGHPLTIDEFDLGCIQRRAIRFAAHCFGCTAGAGSSCGGATA